MKTDQSDPRNAKLEGIRKGAERIKWCVDIKWVGQVYGGKAIKKLKIDDIDFILNVFRNWDPVECQKREECFKKD